MSEKRAGALGAKTARPCDSCLRKRARWFCAADDAFLCQSCDTTVHAANSLAKRHERVRLKTASSSSHNPNERPRADHVQPAWHGGFKRKARTSRPHPFPNKLTKTEPSSLTHSLLVPELGEEPLEENDEQLLYRVPILDPGLAELCTDPMAISTAVIVVEMKSEPLMGNINSVPGFIPSDTDLAEFEIDVNSLLGTGLEEGSFCMEELGLLESRGPELEWGGEGSSSNSGRVKVEEEEVGSHFESEMHTLELDFDYDTLATCEEEEKVDGHVGLEKVGSFSLRLDYEAVMTAWAGQDPPWMTGDRPQFNIDEFWPDCTDIYGSDVNPNGDVMVGVHVSGGGGDGGREARVSRYREKRRTRLFQKKIRYEVRKLNAEKRPRMKGRFVKRAPAPALHPVW